MDFSADQIAALLGGEVDGDGNVAVSTFAKIEEGRPGALSFLANPKYAHYIYTTDSSIVLVDRTFVPDKPVKATLIRVDNPYEKLSQLLEFAAQAMQPKHKGIEQPCFIADGVEIPEDAYVGAFAYIGAGAVIGKGVQIYPHSYVGCNANIGENTILYSGVKVYYGCRIGARCILHSGAVIGADGFGFAPTANGTYHKIPQIGIVEIGDDVEIGANTTVDRATMGSTRIGNGTKLDNLIQAAHNTEIGENTVIAAQTGIAGSTKLGSNCIVAGQVGFSGHIRVGDRVTVGPQTGVPKSVADDRTIMGYPAVESTDFLRQAAYLKQLGSLFAKVAELEKAVKKDK